ncbi:alkanesulfonate monooxygenase [Burkholderia mallei]|nr:alkanesulfonate monooxygenase [Burkholderia mallei]
MCSGSSPHGDSRYLGTAEGARAADYDYFRQVAVAADTLGYDGVLLPTGRSCEDAWVVASSLIPATKRLKFLVAIRPGLSSPGLSADGVDVRPALRWAFADQRRDGRRFGRARRRWPLRRSRHALRDHRRLPAHLARAARRIARERRHRFRRRAPEREGRQAAVPAVQRPHPPLWFGGSSPAAHAIAADHIDTYLSWASRPRRSREDRRHPRARPRAAARSSSGFACT